MRDWTAISAFDGIDLANSYVMSWAAERQALVIEADFVLTKAHPEHRQPRPDEWACFRRGILRFSNVREIVGLPSMDEVRPAVDATGEEDYGNFDSFVELMPGQFEVSGEFGSFRVKSDQPEIEI